MKGVSKFNFFINKIKFYLFYWLEKLMIRFSRYMLIFQKFSLNGSQLEWNPVNYCDFRKPMNVLFLVKVTNENSLYNTVESLLRQTNENWKALIVLNDSSNYKNMKKLEQPQKIFLCDSASNKKIKDLLKYVYSDYICCLESGDEVGKKLVEILQRIDADIIYFDQIVFSRVTGYKLLLKPKWSPELWLSVDILKGAVYKSKLFMGDDKDYLNEYAQALFYANRIFHIPMVLLHSKKFPWEDEILIEEHKRRVEDYLLLRGQVLSTKIEKRPNGSSFLQFLGDQNKISIIIPNKNHPNEIMRSVNSIFENSVNQKFEIIIVDDESNEPEVINFYNTLYSKHNNFDLLNGSRPFNFSRACNQGAAKATGELLLFLNNDTEIIDPHWLKNLAGVLQIPGVGAVGPKLLYPDGSVQHAGIVIGLEGHASHVFMGVKSDIYTPYGYVDWMRNVSAVTGACMMVRRDVFEQVGGFDESLTLAFGDVDLCLRIIDAGYRIVYTPDVKLIHYEGRSRGKYIPKQDLLAKRDYFREKIKQGDPYYNPNLSRAWRIPTIRQKWEMDPVERYDKLIEFMTR
ncbi:MAG: glycosyltransferase family 2 protein [Chloroflexota bacterium]